MLSDIQISALETAAESFGGINDLYHAIHQYRIELASLNKDVWNSKLANIERINPTAYANVLASLAPDRASELTAFVAQYKGQPLPEVQRAATLSEAKVIAAAKSGGTIIKP